MRGSSDVYNHHFLLGLLRVCLQIPNGRFFGLFLPPFRAILGLIIQYVLRIGHVFLDLKILLKHFLHPRLEFLNDFCMV